MADFEPITTQEAFDNAIKERINRLNEKHTREISEKYGDYDAMSSKITELETNVASLTASLDDANAKLATSTTDIAERDARIKGYEIQELKNRIALDAGLSYDAIDFLRGDSEEEIRQSADALKSLVGQKKTAPLASSEAVVTKGENASYKEMLNNLF